MLNPVRLNHQCGPLPAASTPVILPRELAGQLTPEQHVDQFTQLQGPVHGVEKELRSHGYRTAVLGLTKLGEATALIEGRERWWVLGRGIELCPDGDRIFEMLLRAGYPVARRWLRVAYAMPEKWQPTDTLGHVFPWVLTGVIPDDRRLIGVPVLDRSQTWAVWIVVDPKARALRSELETYT